MESAITAGEHELRPICEAHAGLEHYDGYAYKFKGVEIKPYKRPGYPVVVTIHLESIYAGGFHDKFAFKYAVHETGGIGRVPPPYIPRFHEHIFDAYDTWGFAVERWARLVKTHYCLKARKARFAPVHEELAAKLWHPDRLARLLEQGGWDAVEGV